VLLDVVPPADREAVLGGTAVRVYGLEGVLSRVP
jgi:hypothetical protein